MSSAFFSDQWMTDAADQVRGSRDVAEAAREWVYGPVLWVLDDAAEPAVTGGALRFDVRDGNVQRVERADPSSAMLHPFAFAGSLSHWKAVSAGQLDIVDAVLESKLRFRGDVPIARRHRALWKALAASCGAVATTWQDEAEPAAAATR